MKLTLLERLSGALLGALWLLVVLSLLLPVPALRALAMLCLAAFLACAVPRASTHIRVLSVVTACVVGWVAWRSGSWKPLEAGLGAGIVFGAFIPTIMLLRATADESPLLHETRGRIDAWTPAQIRFWVQGVAHVLGSFLMIGGYVIARSALPKTLGDGPRAQIGESAVRGLGLAACWSPFFVNSAIASQLVPGIPAWQLVGLGLAFALLGWALSRFFFFREMSAAALYEALRATAGFALPSAVLVALVIALSLATGLRNLEAVVLLVPAVCLLYLAGRGRASLARALRRVPPTLAKLSDEILVITVAMCLGAAIAGAGVWKEAPALVAGLAGLPSVLIAAEVAVIVGAGFLGVHPMISATVLLPLLAGVNRGIADLALAYVVVLGWALSAMLAIWTLPVASAATTFDVSVRRLALGANVRFVLAFGVCGCLALAGLNRLLAS